jgi:hypothetical protein
VNVETPQDCGNLVREEIEILVINQNRQVQDQGNGKNFFGFRRGAIVNPMSGIMIEDDAEQVNKNDRTTAPEVKQQTADEQIEITEPRRREKVEG